MSYPVVALLVSFAALITPIHVQVPRSNYDSDDGLQENSIDGLDMNTLQKTNGYDDRNIDNSNGGSQKFDIHSSKHYGYYHSGHNHYHNHNHNDGHHLNFNLYKDLNQFLDTYNHGRHSSHAYYSNYSDGKNSSRSFTIKHNSFRKDGAQFRYVSGSVHYFRVHPAHWSDTLGKMRYAGLNAVQTYVEWASHEPEPGQYEFSGGLDLVEFIQEAQRHNLLVILRLGPYICAERDMGGLPYWLLRLHPNIRLRTSDPAYVSRVDSWLLDGLLPRLRPLLYGRGGPVILLQLENEYGNYYSCDYSYTSHLRQVVRQGLALSDTDAVLFTTDNGSPTSLRCGKIPEVYATVDFGPTADPLYEFGSQRLFEPRGPLVNSEFYSGWLDHWGERHHKTPAGEFSSSLDILLALGASVNIYMFHGGTNFGFSAGANQDGLFQAVLTSYDYDAPLSEAGDMTLKYDAVRHVVGKYLPLPDGPAPSNSTKGAYGEVEVKQLGHPLLLAADVGVMLQGRSALYPLSFEQLFVPNGLVVYSTIINITTPDPSLLNLGSLHDRGYVYVNGRLRGVVSKRRSSGSTTLPIRSRPGDVLTVMVESLGRINVGININDMKGLTSNVTLNSHLLTNWTMTPIPLTNYGRLTYAIEKLKIQSVVMKSRPEYNSEEHYSKNSNTGFFEGILEISNNSEEPKDTFMRLDGWTKGIAWVNGFCLGRYWPVMGPQATLYVPAGALQRGPNKLLVLELEGAGCSYGGKTTRCRGPKSGGVCDAKEGFTDDVTEDSRCKVRFVDEPDIDTDVPQM